MPWKKEHAKCSVAVNSLSPQDGSHKANNEIPSREDTKSYVRRGIGCYNNLYGILSLNTIN